MNKRIIDVLIGGLVYMAIGFLVMFVGLGTDTHPGKLPLWFYSIFFAIGLGFITAGFRSILFFVRHIEAKRKRVVTRVVLSICVFCILALVLMKTCSRGHIIIPDANWGVQKVPENP